jgi:hypothetical protein
MLWLGAPIPEQLPKKTFFLARELIDKTVIIGRLFEADLGVFEALIGHDDDGKGNRADFKSFGEFGVASGVAGGDDHTVLFAVGLETRFDDPQQYLTRGARIGIKVDKDRFVVVFDDSVVVFVG